MRLRGEAARPVPEPDGRVRDVALLAPGPARPVAVDLALLQERPIGQQQEIPPRRGRFRRAHLPYAISRRPRRGSPLPPAAPGRRRRPEGGSLTGGARAGSGETSAPRRGRRRERRALRVQIVGATGYGGLGILELLLGHPGFEVASLLARDDAGRRIDDVYPHLSGRCDLVVEQPARGRSAPARTSSSSRPPTASRRTMRRRSGGRGSASSTTPATSASPPPPTTPSTRAPTRRRGGGPPGGGAARERRLRRPRARRRLDPGGADRRQSGLLRHRESSSASRPSSRAICWTAARSRSTASPAPRAPARGRRRRSTSPTSRTTSSRTASSRTSTSWRRS